MREIQTRAFAPIPHRDFSGNGSRAEAGRLGEQRGIGMGVVLGIDCCLRKTSVGCVRNGAILGDIHLDLDRRQAALLPSVQEGLLRVLELDLGDLDAIALTVGPGYFTGVRVGMAYGTALAEALGLPVVPVGTLEALALSAVGASHVVVPVIWARHGASYVGAYRAGGGEALLSPRMAEDGELEGILSLLPSPWTLVGEGTDRFASLAETLKVQRVETHVSAALVALFGERRLGEAMLPQEIRPCYLRKHDVN